MLDPLILGSDARSIFFESLALTQAPLVPNPSATCVLWSAQTLGRAQAPRVRWRSAQPIDLAQAHVCVGSAHP